MCTEPKHTRVLNQVRLMPLMERTEGQADIVVALIDGPVAPSALTKGRIRGVANSPAVGCERLDSAACEHGTFVAAMLVAVRGSQAPAICPACTLLVRPIFGDAVGELDAMPSARPEELAAAIVAAVSEGARVVNLSVSVMSTIATDEHDLRLALDFAAQRGTIVVAAAGNGGAISSSVLTRHRWVIPVTACDAAGAPLGLSNLGASIGNSGLAAPGTDVISLRPDGNPTSSEGTSVAVPFVTGAIALLWSEFLSATASVIKQAVLIPHAYRHRGIVPPILDAWGAFEHLRRSMK